MAVVGAIAVGTPLVVANTANAAPDAVWDKLAQCESGGRWNINTGNGFVGGLQFSPSTWRAYGGAGSAANASREQQIAVAERVLAAQGWNAWPACSRKLGLRGYAAEPNKVRASAPVAAAAPAPAPAAPAAPVTKNGADYTVVAGDTLSRIAARQNIPGGWKTIWDRNTDVLSNPNVLRIGQQLDLR